TLSVEWSSRPSNTEAPTASIIIPCYDGKSLTDACLRSLFATLPSTFRGEVIAVDDESTDGTAGLLRHWAKTEPRLVVVRNKKDVGFVGSATRGARHATGDILISLHNAVVLLPGWFEPMLRVFRDRPDAGACGGKLILSDGTLQEAGSVVFRDGSAM